MGNVGLRQREHGVRKVGTALAALLPWASACFTEPFQPLSCRATQGDTAQGPKALKRRRSTGFDQRARPSFSRRWLPGGGTAPVMGPTRDETPFVSFSRLVFIPGRGPASRIKLSTSRSFQFNPLPWNPPPDHHLRPSGVPSFPFPEASDFNSVVYGFFGFFQARGERSGSFQMRSRCGCPGQDFPRKAILEDDLRGEARSCSCGKQPWNSGGIGRKKKECGDDLAGPLHFPPQE
ncbi:hypothetical protein BO79DRAFT_229819 [Aspergillus costaricaensis CBS 115574]|uniref:Uncharacterized protein n=1 Tax=Aspergillus costaricaensis CBS 115574 TaxID=1448317 RepID=A0ACD1IBL4_9EURO|nr:hypothetical protein BO79DRAFT_229819 [Aspergillus costaricaensis CBS 115574]RAK87472.1 hypothetical protein BO79DRAFT_229819 [Aspergillus costaricaensis CBS 115574]